MKEAEHDLFWRRLVVEVAADIPTLPSREEFQSY